MGSNYDASAVWAGMVEACRPQHECASPRLWPAFWQHDPTSEGSRQAWIDSTLRFYETTNTSLIKLTGPAHYQVADRGVAGSWQGAPLGERTFTQRAVHDLHDWRRIQPGITRAEELVVEVTSDIRCALPPDVPLLVTVFTPATQAMMLAEPARFAAHVQSSPEIIRDALHQLAGQTAGLIRLFREAGANGIFLVSKHHDTRRIPQTDYLSVIAESDRATMEACQCFPANIFHLHGEPIHVDGWPVQGDWIIHVEAGALNPTFSRIRANTPHAVLLPLPYAVWDSEVITPHIRAGLEALGQHSAIIGSPCAVPLRYTRYEIAAWIARAKESHAALATD